jgi:alpha-ketoglutarate-dependent taurine dioxygenase
MDVVEFDSVHGQREYNNATFPAVLRPKGDISKDRFIIWLAENIDLVNNLVLKYGVIIFRGFPLLNAEDFYDFLKPFNWEYKNYIGGGGPRKNILGPILTSTESPPEFIIPLHHELAYLNSHPSKLIFFCEVPPYAKGETPVLLSSRIVDRVRTENSEFYQALKTKHVRYIRTIDDRSQCKNEYQKSWQDIYDSDDKSEAESRARYTGTDTIEWLPNGAMRVTTVPMDPTRIEPRTQKEIWFNSVVLLHPAAHDDLKNAPWNVVYGDYTYIKPSDIKMVKNIMLEESIEIPWQQGDVMIVDNMLAMHARNSFTPPRRILAAMVHN